jgi:hypothetical protein
LFESKNEVALAARAGRADAPSVSDAVGDANTVELPLRMEEGVGDGVP